MNSINTQLNGLLLCAKYAFMPNKLQYCGGDRNSELFNFGIQNQSDPFLGTLLKEFETLYPYLTLIASSNGIKDPFDQKVVEAYWIGNELLEKTDMKKLYWHFVDALKLKNKMTPQQFTDLVGQIPPQAKPHHSFHVFNIWLRTGNLPIAHTIQTVNDCRIGWGKITKILPNELEIETPVIEEKLEKLLLSKPQKKTVIYKMLNESFIKNPQINDLISYHWNFACDKITESQAINLQRYTLANLTQ